MSTTKHQRCAAASAAAENLRDGHDSDAPRKPLHPLQRRVPIGWHGWRPLGAFLRHQHTQCAANRDEKCACISVLLP